jgi:predicted nucleotidyltransferase
MWWRRRSSATRTFDQVERDRLVGLITAHADLRSWDLDSIYLSGSHSQASSRRPRPDSDVDVYVFVRDFTSEYDRNLTLARTLKGLLGWPFDVHIAHVTYREAAAHGMEQLYEARRRVRRRRATIPPNGAPDG